MVRQLSALKQQAKYMLSALSFKMAAPVIMEVVVQVLIFDGTDNPSLVNRVVKTMYQ